MHWIKEVETATSIDELVTSRSILGRTDFTDYDTLDATTASALLKESVEEQRAPKYDRFLRWKQIANIYGHFRAKGTYEAA